MPALNGVQRMLDVVDPSGTGFSCAGLSLANGFLKRGFDLTAFMTTSRGRRRDPRCRKSWQNQWWKNGLLDVRVDGTLHVLQKRCLQALTHVVNCRCREGELVGRRRRRHDLRRDVGDVGNAGGATIGRHGLVKVDRLATRGAGRAARPKEVSTHGGQSFGRGRSRPGKPSCWAYWCPGPNCPLARLFFCSLSPRATQGRHARDSECPWLGCAGLVRGLR